MCFKVDGESVQVAKCVKYWIMTKVTDCVIYVDTFEQQYDVLKVVLQSLRLKYHINTIGIDQ